MQNLVVDATAKTPAILFDNNSGDLSIKGRSIPVNAEEFWSPALTWLEHFIASKPQAIHLTFDIEYLNISSSKRILFALYKLNEANKNGIDCNITWKHKTGDAHIKEVGEDYAFMVQVPFQHLPYNETEMALAV